MKAVGFVLAPLMLVPWMLASQLQTITTREARAHDGENAKVCGVVTNEHVATGSKGQPTFIDLDSAFPEQVFAIVVWDVDRKNVGELPHTKEHVCATGLIAYYHGVPQIMVKSSSQLSR